MTGPADEPEPFAVVDRFAELPLFAEELDSDLLQALASQPGIEVLQPQLMREAS